ncbi:uncharacterized protein LOC133297862, partial [Gastrolobium bilobum]|uniref:uncharacterized protein LOC133297862 n=1 Tax=Gastrolobium bilobum TaxID=150636 RepID=UPI002AAF91A4
IPLLYPLAALNARDLDKFLKSIGRDPSYVDFEANPTVGKDQPPDLVALVPSGSIVLPENHVSVDNKSKTISAKVVSEKNTKWKPVNNTHSSRSFADVDLFVEEILHKTSELLLSEINEDTIQKHGEHLGTRVSENLRKALSSDMKNLSMIFKNKAYTEGFHAGTHSQRRHL